eukprot:scaffold23090_cov65-Phaeocystis_antarctica.AAC.8
MIRGERSVPTPQKRGATQPAASREGATHASYAMRAEKSSSPTCIYTYYGTRGAATAPLLLTTYSLTSLPEEQPQLHTRRLGAASFSSNSFSSLERAARLRARSALRAAAAFSATARTDPTRPTAARPAEVHRSAARPPCTGARPCAAHPDAARPSAERPAAKSARSAMKSQKSRVSRKKAVLCRQSRFSLAGCCCRQSRLAAERARHWLRTGAARWSPGPSILPGAVDSCAVGCAAAAAALAAALSACTLLWPFRRWLGLGSSVTSADCGRGRPTVRRAWSHMARLGGGRPRVALAQPQVHAGNRQQQRRRTRHLKGAQVAAQRQLVLYRGRRLGRRREQPLAAVGRGQRLQQCERLRLERAASVARLRRRHLGLGGQGGLVRPAPTTPAVGCRRGGHCWLGGPSARIVRGARAGGSCG